MSADSLIQLGILLGTMIGTLAVCGQVLISRFDRLSNGIHQRLDKIEQEYRYNYVTKEVHDRDILRLQENIKAIKRPMFS